MNFSYWENKHLVKVSEFTIIGSGITGLSTAIFLKKKYPDSNIRVLERGMTPWGASTKNAGFACFGSISEILSDIDHVGLDQTIELVEKRWKGLLTLRELLGDQNIGLLNFGGYELFTSEQKHIETRCLESLEQLNSELQHIFKDQVFSIATNSFGFKQLSSLVVNKFESQIDTGLMMFNLIHLAKELGVEINFGCEVLDYQKKNDQIQIQLAGGMTLETKQLLICTNGFAKQDFGFDVKPARAQVLITKPIQDLKIKGTFHLEEGYYYFRNIDDRILFGGGRNLDFEGETTTEMETTEKIMSQLNTYLKTVILPNTPYEIDYSWAGIMGVGQEKAPIIKQVEEQVYCGLRLGGMGVAIGTLVGKELADLVKR